MSELYPYQEQYISKLPARGIVDAELGLGKSIMSLEYYKRHNNGEPLLIVAPASKARSGDWERECEAVGIENYRLISRERLATAKIQGKPLWHQFAPKFGGTQHSVIYDENVGLRNPSTSIFKKMKYIADEAPIFLILTSCIASREAMAAIAPGLSAMSTVSTCSVLIGPLEASMKDSR